VLTSDVPTEKREAWFERKIREGIQVTICHPKIIETGLDLLSHPSLIFYQPGYSLHTLRQASRRSWRIGQCQAVRVFHLHYAGTMQASCLRLMAKKMLVSLAMEGKFSGGGLQSFEEDDDMLTAMARELVTKHGIGESADALWKQLQAQQVRTQSPKQVAPQDPEVDTAGPPPVTMPTFASTLEFGVRPQAVPTQRQPVRSTAPEQLSFF